MFRQLFTDALTDTHLSAESVVFGRNIQNDDDDRHRLVPLKLNSLFIISIIILFF